MRNQRQRQRQTLTVVDSSPDIYDVVTVRPDNDGKRCIDKVEMVEVIEYKDHVECNHSYDKRCHTSYVTSFVSVQEEECDENFKKVRSVGVASSN